jgi:predicted nuclease with TOPRIM domain
MNLKEYNKLKRQVETLKREADESKGAEDQLLQQLKSSFKCSNLDEAKDLLRKLRTKKKKLEQQLNTKKTRFEKTWVEHLT